MVYTVQMDLCIDDDEIYDDEVIEELVKEGMDAISASANNIRVIEVND